MSAHSQLPMDINISKVARGLTSYIKRLLIQTALAEGFPDILNDYKSILDLANYTDTKDLKMLRELVVSLVKLGIIDQKGDLFKWIGGEIRVTEDEEYVKPLAEPWITMLQTYMKKFPDLLKGRSRLSLKEPGIWDSVYSTPIYQFIWLNTIKQLNITNDSVILDLGCKTGWNTINILNNYDPKNVVAVDVNQDFLNVADENICNFACEKRFKVILIRHDFTNEIDLTGCLGDEKPDKVIVSYLFHWYPETDYLNILSNIRKVLAEDAEIVFIQPHIVYRNQPIFFQLPLYVEDGFKGYPLLETLANTIIASGFSMTKREYNICLYSKMGCGQTKPLRISADPPKYCKICGGELQENAFFCAYCRNTVDFNVNLPLL
ncbi:MAG: class I SAM-dependent methyltransferase [Candidatus Odinarchaeota archaeon]